MSFTNAPRFFCASNYSLSGSNSSQCSWQKIHDLDSPSMEEEFHATIMNWKGEPLNPSLTVVLCFWSLYTENYSIIMLRMQYLNRTNTCALVGILRENA